MMHHSLSDSVFVGVPGVRQGRIGPLLLAVVTITFLCGILVINSYFVTQMRVQQENATDAAALAAAEVLAHEELLYGDPTIFGLQLPAPPSATPADSDNPLFGSAAQSAITFAAKNFVGGKSFDLRVEDIAFGVADVQTRTSRSLMSAAIDPPAAFATPLTLKQKRALNSVQVIGQRTKARGNALLAPIFNRVSWEMTTRSEAVLDGYIYGFHTDPNGDINIPMAPIGLNAQSWSAQVESQVDQSLETPANGQLRFGDFRVMIGAISQDPDFNDSSKIAPMIHFCTSTLSEAAAQFTPNRPGITPTQYGVFFQENNNQPLALDTNTLQLALPTAPQPNGSNAEFATLQANLLGLKTNGTRLIWPLISGYNDGKGQRQAVIVGFVAARILDVKRVSYRLLTDKNGNTIRDSKELGSCNEGMDDQGRTRRPYDLLSLTLHPTLLATSTGLVFVRNWPAGDPGQYAFRFPNAYVKKIRLLK